jgi:hypothetical protein
VATPSPVKVEQFLNRLDKTLVPEDTSEISFYLESATEAAEGWHNVGPIVVRGFTERRATNKNRRLIVSYTPVTTVTTATRVLDGQVWATADLEVDTEAGIIGGLGYRLPAGLYDLVYSAGRDPVPVSLEMAVLLIAEHNWRPKQGPRTRGFRGQQIDQASEELRARNGFVIPRSALTYLSAEAEPFAIGTG